MLLLITILIGILSGVVIKQTINWLYIDNLKIKGNNFIIEVFCGLTWFWAFNELAFFDAVLCSIIVSLLIGISYVDLFTMKVPLIFILIGFAVLLIAIFLKIIFLRSALLGIFVGAVIPLIITGVMWMMTKRQGMGFGDIQIGVILGAWLGPMRMGIALFCASFLSLIFWLFISFYKGFDKDRAMPLAPFLSLAGTGIFVGSIYYPELFYLLIV